MMSEASFASLGPSLLARKGGAKPAMRPQLTPLPEDLSSLAALADEQLEDLGWNDMGTDRDEISDGDAGKPLLPAKTSNTVAMTGSHSSEAGADRDWTTGQSQGSDYASGYDAGDDEDFGGAFGEEYGADNDEDAPGPHPIIDPMTSAQVVPLNARTRRRTALGASGKLAANEDAASAHTDPLQRKQAGDESNRPARSIFSGPLSPMAPARNASPHSARKDNRKGDRKNGAKRAAFTLRLDTDRHLKLRLAATMQGVSAQSLVTQALDAMLQEIEALDTLVERMRRD
jgi:hypothetical protein